MEEGEPQSRAPDASFMTSGSLLSAGKDGSGLGPKSGVWEGGILGGEDAPALSERSRKWCSVAGQACGLLDGDRGRYLRLNFQPRWEIGGQQPACLIGGNPEVGEKRSLPRHRPGAPVFGTSTARRTVEEPPTDLGWNWGRGAGGE